MEEYSLRDPVHHHITFDDFERSLIDQPFFQRLRFIGQLSFLQTYVYPGGVHDRFTHALGVMHVAGRIFDRLLDSSSVLREQFSHDELAALRRRVRLAGLLHDIGHGPFSHASESIFPSLQELPLNWSWWRSPAPRQAKHEDYSVLLIQTMADRGGIDRSLAQDVCSLIHGGIVPAMTNMPALLKSVISGEVDADRMDYLLRDSYFCGVAYGYYDLDWLIASLGLAMSAGRMILTISENGVRAFEDLLLARYHMIDQVYFHKTKAGFNHYLEEAIREQEIPLIIPTDPDAYAELRDGRVIEMLFAAARNPANYWSHHLMRRLPAKRIIRLHEAKADDMATLAELRQRCEEHGIRYFTHAARNELSHFGEKSEASGMLYVAKKTLAGFDYLPVFEYSDLLQKYNEKLRFVDFFVRREDINKFFSAWGG